MNDAERAAAFERELRALFPEWRRAAGLPQGRLPQLISNHTAVGAARHLLRKAGLSTGFIKLRDAHRLDLTIEWLVLHPNFGSLFSPEERSIARRKLLENGAARSDFPLEPYSS